MSETVTYETDFHAWAIQNARLLREGKLTKLDAEHIAEELEGMASPAYLKGRGMPEEPEALREHQALHALARTGEPLQWVLQRGKLRWQGLPPGRAIMHSPDLLVHMAIHGAGITIAEERSAEPYVKAGQLARVLPDWKFPPMPLWAVFPGRKLMPARTRAFIDALSAKFGSPQ